MHIAQSGFTQEEAAKHLQLSPSHIYRLIRHKKLKLTTLAGSPIILLEDERNARFFAERRKYLQARNLLPAEPAQK